MYLVLEEESYFFACSAITTHLKVQFREPPVKIWGAENMLFPSGDLILYMIFPVQLCTAPQN